MPGLPPPPPGEVVEWAVAIIVVGIAVVGLGFLAKYLIDTIRQPKTAERPAELAEVMKELLSEVRALREEIERLRREMRE